MGDVEALFHWGLNMDNHHEAMNIFGMGIRRNLTLRVVGLDPSPASGYEEPGAPCVTPVGTTLEVEMKACGMMCWVLDLPEFPSGFRRTADPYVCHAAFTGH